MATPVPLAVRAVMTVDPVRCDPDRPIQEALEEMTRLRIGAVLVADGERLVGIFTERDFLKRATGASPGWRTMPVREWMTPDPHTIGPDVEWEEAARTMERLRVRHLPVLDGGQIVGVVSFRQLMARRAEYLNRVVADRTRDVRRANEALLARDAEMGHYMKVAAKLQKRLVLPHAPPDWPEVGWGVHFAPLDPLGGDFYDFAQPDADRLGVLIADASGHGIPAAMVAIMARQAFSEAAPFTSRPGEVLAAMNRRLQDLTDERFVTAFYGVFDRRTRRLTYANAGHPFPYRYDARAGTCQPLARGGSSSASCRTRCTPSGRWSWHRGTDWCCTRTACRTAGTSAARGTARSA